MTIEALTGGTKMERAMEFYLRRAVYKAVQFDGTAESAKEILGITGARGYTITYEPMKGPLFLTLLEATPNSGSKVVRFGEYLVVAPDGVAYVVDGRDFERRYEQAINGVW